MTIRARYPSTWLALAYIAFGPLVWAACHGLLYAAHWLLCVLLVRDILTAGAIHGVLLIIATVCAIILSLTIRRPGALAQVMLAGVSREAWMFSRSAMRLLAALSLFGVVAAGAAVLALPVCG
jgi:hypothetical protein